MSSLVPRVARGLSLLACCTSSRLAAGLPGRAARTAAQTARPHAIGAMTAAVAVAVAAGIVIAAVAFNASTNAAGLIFPLFFLLRCCGNRNWQTQPHSQWCFRREFPEIVDEICTRQCLLRP